jgi:hypothetical protein
MTNSGKKPFFFGLFFVLFGQIILISSKHTYRVYINPQLPMVQVNNVSTTERGVRRILLTDEMKTSNGIARSMNGEKTLTSAYSSLEERRMCFFLVFFLAFFFTFLYFLFILVTKKSCPHE